jgi:DNA-binding winged helix-turn-helix (wHTH) protein
LRPPANHLALKSAPPANLLKPVAMSYPLILWTRNFWVYFVIMAPPERVVFGSFEVDLAAATLLKRGLRVRLSAQPFRILGLLVSRPGQVISQEELRKEIWGDGTFVDFEHSLHAAMNKLRSALGDSAENPRYIETLPGRGFASSAS